MTGGEKPNFTGIVLAGGKSSRMGVDKGLIIWQQKRLVEYPVRVLEQFCEDIFICTQNQAYKFLGYPLIRDLHRNIGPMGGLHAGLRASKTEHNFVLSCDMPLVDSALIQKILQNSDGFQAVVPVVNGNSFPLCAYYHQSVLVVIEQLISEKWFKLKNMLMQLNVKEIDITDERSKAKLLNVNSMEDLKWLNHGK